MNFYNLFVEMCNKNNIKPSVAAENIGISKSNVSNWKRRNTFPTDANLKKIADYFGVTVDYLLGKEKTSADNSEGDKNTIRIAGRDGSLVERTLTDEQLDLIKKMIEQMPDADNL